VKSRARGPDHAPAEKVDRYAAQLILYVAEPHVGDRRSRIDQLLRRAAADGVAGATVVAAHQGFGRRHAHEPTVWHRADETPLTLIIVDATERIEAFLSEVVPEFLPDAVAVVSRVRAIHYVPPAP
jgi:PII-like signaling protein